MDLCVHLAWKYTHSQYFCFTYYYIQKDTLKGCQGQSYKNYLLFDRFLLSHSFPECLPIFPIHYDVEFRSLTHWWSNNNPTALASSHLWTEVAFSFFTLRMWNVNIYGLDGGRGIENIVSLSYVSLPLVFALYYDHENMEMVMVTWFVLGSHELLWPSLWVRLLTQASYSYIAHAT